MEPDNNDFLTNFGISKLLQGDFTAARELLESSLAIAPDNERTQAMISHLDVAEVAAMVRRRDNDAAAPVARASRPARPSNLNPHRIPSHAP